MRKFKLFNVLLIMITALFCYSCDIEDLLDREEDEKVENNENNDNYEFDEHDFVVIEKAEDWDKGVYFANGNQFFVNFHEGTQKIKQQMAFVMTEG